MTGHKKIVGLWRDSAANQEADSKAPAEVTAPENPAAPEAAMAGAPGDPAILRQIKRTIYEIA